MSNPYMEEPSSKKTTTASRICYIAPDVPIPSPRGSSVHVTEIARSLASSGHEVHVICRRIRRSEPRFDKMDGINLHRIYRFVLFPGGKGELAGRSSSETHRGFTARVYQLYLRSLFSLYASLATAYVIRKNKLNFIIERETSFGAGGLASVFARIPMILEIVGPRYSRLSVWRSKRILYYTGSMLRKWVDRSKCIQVSGGVNLLLFHEDKSLREVCRERLGFSEQDRVIGYVGTFQDWHGIDTLIHSFVELRDSYPNIRALMVGPYYEKYTALAKSLGVDDICVFTGPVNYEKVPEYINAADVMVALYEPEKNEIRKKYGIGSPLKILEYMACGKPVIGTDVEPVNSVILKGYSGYLVKPSDKEELSALISSILCNQKESETIGAHGKQIVESRYSWKQLGDRIRSILEDLNS